MVGWVDGWMDGWMDVWIAGWVGRWMDGWVDGWMDGWMDGWVDGWADVSNMCPKVDSVTIHRLGGPLRSFPTEASTPESGY